MIQIIEILLFACGTVAFVRAWMRTRATSLFHAVHWGCAAWLAWTLPTFLQWVSGPAGLPPYVAHAFCYVALCLTGCAGVAVLGARRPHVTAWNFVLLGLLAVMVLPLFEQALIGTRSLDGLRITFLAATLGIGILNYLPTRFGPAAFLAGLICAAALLMVAAPQALPQRPEAEAIRLFMVAAPGFAMGRLFPVAQATDLDCIWRDFRDRWGLVWGLRVREQFNRAAANAGWPVTLTWSGFTFQQPVDAAVRAEIRATLLALLQRFISNK